MFRAPVCSREIDPRTVHSMKIVDGHAVYFCCADCAKAFISDPQGFNSAASGMRLTVGLMGSTANEESPAIQKTAYELGEAIARHGFILMTGACPGLPHKAACGAIDAGGQSIGISPALSLYEHVYRYGSPAGAFDALIYTGSGLMGREVTNIHSSDMVVIVGGRSGTLGEFAIEYDEGKLIGILKGTGGTTDEVETIEGTFDKNIGARLVEQLVKNLVYLCLS